MASSGIAHNSPVEAFKGQNYEELKKEHLRAKKLFVDPAGLDGKRPKDIFKTPKFITNGMTRTDVVQGRLANCWFMSAAASLTLRPQLLQQVVPLGQDFDDEYAGIFHFRFWQFGKWVEVVVDDQLLWNDAEQNLQYGRLTEENEFWMPLLEKAYAKLKGSYEALIRGFSKNAFVNLTGGIGEIIQLRCCDPENLCKRAERALGRNSVMAADILGEPGERRDGLFNSHSYSVTKIHKVTVEGKKTTLVRLRNPHGETEWNGDWSDYDKRNWSKVNVKVRKNLLMMKDDGEFWMNLDDFRKHFDVLEICHLSADAPREECAPFRWHSSSFHGRWESVNVLEIADAFWTNPQFYVSLSEDSEILISLIQKSKKDLLPIGFDVYEYLESPDQRRTFLKQKIEAVYIAAEDRTEPLELPCGNYLIMPMNDAFEEGEFLLRIFTEKEHQSREL